MIVIFNYLADLRYSWGIQTIWKINRRVLWKCKARCGWNEWFEQWQTDICVPGTLFGEYHGQFLCTPLWSQIHRLFISLVMWNVTSSLKIYNCIISSHFWSNSEKR